MMLNEKEIRWPEGLKKTKQRIQVLEALTTCGLPVTAMELSSRLERDGTQVWLSTVYRILDSFVCAGLVEKTPVPDSGMAVYEIKDDKHKHYAVCVRCHKVIQLHNCPMESFRPELSEAGFHILGHRLQMYGYCAHCTIEEP